MAKFCTIYLTSKAKADVISAKNKLVKDLDRQVSFEEFFEILDHMPRKEFYNLFVKGYNLMLEKKKVDIYA